MTHLETVQLIHFKAQWLIMTILWKIWVCIYQSVPQKHLFLFPLT